ncbi:Hypothetical predicted protein [Olea europaea subsp. europaea]|uniref:J domain-containing protein n=1 Tax=Olea europaea subsp. europaea TaxID=158383 RepID=A0A8S0UB88_OLEEU|nr:Hypothetical predicted protein [Olea europaea subsp. europaea]
MGYHSNKTKKFRKKKLSSESSTSIDQSSATLSSPSSSDEFESSKRHKRTHKRRHGKREEGRKSKKSRRDYKEEKKKHTKETRKEKRREKNKRRYGSDDQGGSGSEESEPERRWETPEVVAKYILKEFPGVSGDLEQLLQMIDDGQAVDISGLSEKSLVKHLRKLFMSLNLKESGNLVFLLPSKVGPTLEVVGPIIRSHAQPQKQPLNYPVSQTEDSMMADSECKNMTENDLNDKKEDSVGPKRRMIGPEMPSAELLSVAAKLTEAEAELREAELDEDTELFIGPPPPAVVTEAESANEAERFEEITRIMGAEDDSPYDVLSVNKNMSAENIKKRYWKLSLMVHPDKCSHPQAHQAFVKLNKAFKDLQDPDKRKALDEKITLKEEQEEFKAELKAMREAAQWRRLQGITMEGDDILLAEMDVKVAPKREEWMTTLPPERKPGMTMQSTRFSKSSKEGRGDTSAWTDTPSEKAQRAKMNYLEAYNEATAIASKEHEKKTVNMDAELVDQYNKAKRSKSLVEKHKESAKSSSKKKSKQETVKEEWEGKHPWKPWDRENDLTAGRQKVKLDAENMAAGLTSRFASGSFQRNFL